jgi:hypothetical protein
MLEPDRRYDGVVIDAGLTQAQTGTPGFWFKIKTDDGTITKDEWVTPDTKVRVAKTMLECFGITQEQLASEKFIDELGEHTNGSEVSITTKEEFLQNGDTVVKVQWMNPRGFTKKPPTPATKSRVAALFGAASPGPLPGRTDGPPPFAPIDDVPW